MFDRVYIKGFRGIREATIGDMKQVNVFFGKNNCGKSSLLESLFLISGLSDPMLPFNVNILRDYKKLSKKDIALDFYNLNTAEPIHVIAENQEAIIQASKKNNVQVFATTHDMDSIKGLRDTTQELAPEDASNISAYKLQKKVDGNLVAYHYTYRSLDYSINQDIEIR